MCEVTLHILFILQSIFSPLQMLRELLGDRLYRKLCCGETMRLNATFVFS